MGNRSNRVTVLLMPANAPRQPTHWQPAADVYHAPDGWLLKFDLAGVRPEDLEVKVENPRVTVQGVRRDYLIEEGLFHHSLEISYNRFERTITLPGDLAGCDYRWEFRDGILLVRIYTTTGKSRG